MNNRKKFEVIVIGGGQAGLSVGYHLQRAGIEFVILDGSDRVGDVWRRRWDSLRPFTPAKFSSLDGMPFPAPPDSFPSKDQMADYLESYAARFELPVLNGVQVERLCKTKGGFRAEAGQRVFDARQVIVAMSNYQKPAIPAFVHVGLHFLSAMSSEMIHGVGRDAERIARTAASHARELSAVPVEAALPTAAPTTSALMRS